MSADAQNPLGVSEALGLAKRALEGVTVRIIGEISELSIKAGYKAVYFTIKDEKSSLPCMMWNNRYAESNVDMRVGMLVELSGRFTLYAAKGRMNFDVFTVSMAGEGDLRLKVANLAKKLQSEGLMDPSRKRPVPAFCTSIGLVTSPRGDAVHDVLRTLRRRFPIARVLLAGVPVEGAQAPQRLIEGIETVSNAGAEVVLLVRGGGSYEDLMPFNDEQLARAIAACPCPVVTGIGHEPDTSIADMVADVRASTPTAAAETVSPSRKMLDELLARKLLTMNASIMRRLDRADELVRRYHANPLFSDSEELLAQESLSIDSLAMRLHTAIPNAMRSNDEALLRAKTRMQALLPHALQRFDFKIGSVQEAFTGKADVLLAPFERDLALAASRLNDLSPLTVISRGYSMVQTPDGVIVKSVEQLRVDDDLQVRLADGGFACRVTDISGNDSSVLRTAEGLVEETDEATEWKDTLW